MRYVIAQGEAPEERAFDDTTAAAASESRASIDLRASATGIGVSLKLPTSSLSSTAESSVMGARRCVSWQISGEFRKFLSVY